VGWVHVIFTDAFLRAHRTWGDEIPQGPGGESGEDRYVREWARAGELMGMAQPPRSVRELEQALDDFQPVLRQDERVREALRFLTKPPLPLSTRLPYQILVAGALSTFDPRTRAMLGLRRPWWPAITATRVLLWLVGVVLGGESTSRMRAMERIERLGKTTA
jgi:uncharacterized protein (DUF2236 family)